MHLNNIYIIIILIISLSCSDDKGWGKEGVGEKFTIKRHKSYNYSEMLSGDLDSTQKIEKDNYKERIAVIKENEPKNPNAMKEKNIIKEYLNTFSSALYDLYKDFIELFK